MEKECCRAFGRTSAGEAKLYTLKAGNYEASFTDFGAIWVSFIIREENNATDIVLGFDSAAGYEESSSFYGEIVGRNSNRIKDAAFTINGIRYQLDKNENENNLHSGNAIYGSRIWNTEGPDEEGRSICFTLHSPDGDQGYPGNMDIQVTYTLTETGELHICYEAKADKDTVCNLTNHVYFNLNGHGAGSILDHEMQILADSITPVLPGAIPTGELQAVEGTVFDFRTPRRIGQDIDADDPQLQLTGGYDHNFALSADRAPLHKAAEAWSPQSGLALQVSTDLPGIQFYAGNFQDEKKGKGGADYTRRTGFALETQYYPNSINEPAFASPLLKAGETYHSETVYRLYRK